jgi:hypothetical protein
MRKRQDGHMLDIYGVLMYGNMANGLWPVSVKLSHVRQAMRADLYQKLLVYLFFSFYLFFFVLTMKPI